MVGEIYLKFNAEFCVAEMTAMFRNTFIKFGYKCSEAIVVQGNMNHRYFSISTDDQNHSPKFLGVLNTMFNNIPFGIGVHYNLNENSDFDFRETITIHNFLTEDNYLNYLYIKTLLDLDFFNAESSNHENNGEGDTVRYKIANERFHRDVTQVMNDEVLNYERKQKIISMYKIMTYFHVNEVTENE